MPVIEKTARQNAHELGYALMCYPTIEARESAKASFERMGFTCLDVTETVKAGREFTLYFLGYKIDKPTRKERGCYVRR